MPLTSLTVNSPLDLPSQIARYKVRYQNKLKHARSNVDFALGIGFHMAPSDMELTIGDIPDYTYEIVIATAAQEFGLNNCKNAMPVPSKQTQLVQVTKIKQNLPDPYPNKKAII